MARDITVVQIFITRSAGERMEEANEVMAVAGVGLEGDRYALGTGTYSQSPRNILRHATLIALEDIEAANKLAVQPFLPSEARRNIVVSGISPEELNELAQGNIFRVGQATVRGLERCTPCNNPSLLTGKPGFGEVFKNTGGLRIEILKTGKIAKGDAVLL